VLLVFHGNIVGYESANAIIRGSPESMRTAMMFGEYFPNPGVPILWFKVSMGSAMLVEGIGTFILVLMIFLLTEGCNVGRPSEGSSPIFVGGTVSAIIAITAPLTQAGINPARDFGPRIISFLPAGAQSLSLVLRVDSFGFTSLPLYLGALPPQLVSGLLSHL